MKVILIALSLLLGSTLFTQEVYSAEVTGVAFIDKDGDGVQDPDEEDLGAGVTISLIDSTGTVIMTTTTGPGGVYTFSNVPEGTGYKIRVYGVGRYADSRLFSITELGIVDSVTNQPLGAVNIPITFGNTYLTGSTAPIGTQNPSQQQNTVSSFGP